MIVYVNESEVRRFKESADTLWQGNSYEWEDEQVFHLHFAPVKHAFGRVSPILMLKASEIPADIDKSVTFVLLVDKTKVSLFQCKSGQWVECELSYIPSKEDLYSRNKGLLELNLLENKRVMIVGLGSFGSQIAIELAKAGVGQFALFDFDRVELHNLARHTCTLKELGRLKTDAIYDAILGKNPYAQVDKFPVDINEHIEDGMLDEEVRKANIVICATDNNKSRFNLSEAMVRHQKIGLFGRAITRAEGGDVFRYHPGGPCYCCMVGMGAFNAAEEEITNEVSARRDGRIPAYMSAEDANAIVQVGLSADIEPVCNLMVKLTLMELSRGTNSGIASLEKELVYDYYMWANRRERKFANWAPLPEGGNKPTILRWYGARINKLEGCPVCSTHIVLDEGDDIKDLSDIELKEDYEGLTLE